MDAGDSWLLAVFLACLALSAFFSSAESALVAMPKLRLRYLVESGVKGADKLAKIAEKPERFLATVLLGNNLVNVAVATLGTIMAVASFGPERGPIISIFGVTVLILIFGEVIPKTLAVHHSQRLALAYVNPLRIIELSLYPFVLALDRIGFGFSRLIGVSDEDKKLVSEGEILSAISAGESEGVVEEGEAKILQKVFEFTDRPVSKVMVPRTEITWVEQGTTLSSFLELYSRMRYSRFPVYRENTDNVVGMLHAKDVLMKLTEDAAGRESIIDDLVRPTYFVPESKHLGELLAEMRDGGHHAAIVVDEFGGVAGMVTLGLLTEEIVGDIHDELTGHERDFIVTGDSTYQLDGGFRVDDANEELDLELPSGDYETVAGFILSHLGRIPKQGEQFRYQNLKFVVTEMRGLKISKVILTREKGDTPC